MQTIQAREGQTLVDIVAMYCGNAGLLVAAARANGLSITDELVLWQQLVLPDYQKPVKVIVLQPAKPITTVAMVKEGQTVVDMAMQYLGDAGQMVALALMNNLSITDALTIGQVLTVATPDIKKQWIVDLYIKQGIIPASFDLDTTDLEGIGYWRIAYDFVVS